MRIVAGKYKGRKLKSVVGESVRPTSDRVREAIFNILQFELENKNVCDLFAGTGALGFEALSRGSKHCTFVEKDFKVSKRIRENIEVLGLGEDEYSLWTMTVEQFFKKNNKVFDIIFMDPPYDEELIAPTLESILSTGALPEDGLVVIEHRDSETICEDMLKTLEIIKTKTYGGTKLSIFKKSFS